MLPFASARGSLRPPSCQAPVSQPPPLSSPPLPAIKPGFALAPELPEGQCPSALCQQDGPCLLLRSKELGRIQEARLRCKVSRGKGNTEQCCDQKALNGDKWRIKPEPSVAPFQANFSRLILLARQDAGRECPTLLSLVPFPRLAGPVAHTSLTQAAPLRAKKEERRALMSQRELEDSITRKGNSWSRTQCWCRAPASPAKGGRRQRRQGPER